MEHNNDAVLKLKKNVSEILKDMVYFGQQIKEKSQNLLDENETNSQLAIDNLEYVTLGIAKLMKKVKGNMFALINNLRSNIRDVDDQYPDKLFDKVLDRLDLCQRANVILGPNNKYLFEQSCDKETMVDGLEQCEDDRGHDNHVNSEVEQEVDTSSCENKKKDFSLGLRKRCDTEDTNDSWPDSLCRSSIVDVPIKNSNDGNDRFEEGSRKDLCETEIPPASPTSDSSSTIITDQPDTRSNLDAMKTTFLNILSTSDTNNKNNIGPSNNTQGDSQNRPAEEQSGFCVSPDLFEPSTNTEEVTSVNIGVKDSLIIPGENNSDIANNNSDCSHGTVVGDFCTVKDPVVDDFQTAAIGSYGDETQEINSGNISKIVMDSENQILASDANRVSDENDVNGDKEKQDDYLIQTQEINSGNISKIVMDSENQILASDANRVFDENDVNGDKEKEDDYLIQTQEINSGNISKVVMDSDNQILASDANRVSDVNGDQEKQDDYLIQSPWSVETLKLGSDNDNADHYNTPNKKNTGEQPSIDLDNTEQLSMDSDVTDIVNNSNVTNYAVPIDNDPCNSDAFSDISLHEDSNHSFEFDITDDTGYCNASVMTGIENKGEPGDIDNNIASAEIHNLKESDIVTEDNDSAGNCDLMHVTKVETEDNLVQTLKEEVEMDGNSVRDNLLQLLREVEIPCTENRGKNMVSKLAASADSNSDHEAADKILKLFENESLDDFSDTDTITSDSNCVDIDSLLSSDDDNNSKIVPQEMTHSPVRIDNKTDILSYLKLKEARMDNCFVLLQRLQLNKDEIMKCKDILDTSIDRLCDLSNLRSKRQYNTGSCSDLETTERKRLKKRKRKITDADLETSDSDSDIQITEPRSSTPHLPEHLESKFDDILAKSLMDDLEQSEQSKDSSDETDTSDVKSKKGNNKMRAAKSKRELSKEERKKKSWRNDSLLREKLSSDSDSSSSSSTSSNRSQSSESSKSSNTSLKNRRISRYEHDSDYNNSSDSEKSKTKTNTDASSTDTNDDDSDIAIVSENKDSPKKNDGSSPSKGRRNIRALMSEESLAAETQQAHKEEEERINRLEGRLKLRETLTQSTKGSLEQSQSWSQCSDVEDPFVLDFDDVTGEPLIKVHPKLTRRLKPHQKDGVQFMWDSCYESVSRLKQHSGSGCILAHCMGLGKTYQVLTLIHTLFSHEVTNTNRVLVVCPLSTVNSWKQEAKIAFQGLPEDKFPISIIADKRKISEKYKVVQNWFLKKKGLLVLGYEGFSTITNTSKLNKTDTKTKTHIWEALIDPGPDLVICDEGHLLKNKSSLKSQALNKIKTKRRIMLTGTPLQNNLDEYYYMIQFVKPNLLGNIKEFKTNFVNPITNGQYEDSTKEDIKLMKKRTHVLTKLLKKTIQRVEDTVLREYLPKMIDHALFIQLHNNQIELYNRYSQLCHERRYTKRNRRRFLADFRIFQYISTHPQLLSVAEKLKSTRIKERDVITEEDDNLDCDLEGWWKPLVPEDAQDRIELGTKLVAFKAIIEACEEIGDKILVFSQSLAELQLIENFLNTIGTKKCASWEKKSDYCRMDGTVHPDVRTHICDKFNDKSNSRLRILLMSTKVGGLGLNLTAANRIIIMTVNWNPSYDTQSVFRAYRFGQEKPVYVYRLISLGTMEEKVYQRSITKLAIAHRVIDKHQITRHYQRTDLEELYLCNPTADEERPTPYVPEDKLLAKLISDLPIIFKYHEHQALLANNPADDLSEQEKIAAWDEFEKEKTAKAQLPPPSAIPSVSATVPNGPTYDMAFNIFCNFVKTNSSITEPQKDSEQYYIPKNLLPFTPSSRLIGSQNFIPMKLPSDTTITIDDPSTSTTTDKNIQTTTESNPPLSIPLDYSLPSRKPKNISHKKQNNCSKSDIDKQTIQILDVYAKKSDDGGNTQNNYSNNTNTFNSPNPVGKSNVMVANQMIKKRPANIGKDNGLKIRKRKSNNTYNTENCLKKAKTCDNETSRINSGGQPTVNQSTPIILIDGDEEINSNKIVKNNGQVLSKVSSCFNKHNTKRTEDIITLD